MRAAFRAVAAAALIGLAAAPAHAASHPAVAVTGTTPVAHYAWLTNDGDTDVVETRRANTATVFAGQFVSPAGRPASGAPRIAIDMAGNAVIAWIGASGTSTAVFSRTRATDDAMGPVQQISPSGVAATQVDLAVDSAGNAVYAWKQGQGTSASLRVRRRAADGTLSAVQLASGYGVIAQPRVGVDTAGNAVVAWRRGGSEAGSTALYARSRAAGGTLGPIQTVGLVAGAYDLAVTGDGRAALAWEYPQAGSQVIRGRVRAADGTLSPGQTVSQVGAISAQPAVALSAAGKAFFAWTRAIEGGAAVDGRIRGEGGGLGNALTLGAGNRADAPDLVADRNGNAHYAWVSDAYEAGGQRVRTRQYNAAGTAGETETVSTAGNDASDPRISVDGGGVEVVVWAEQQGADSVIRSHRDGPVGYSVELGR